MNPAQPLGYGFAPGAEFEGRFVGAIERIESGTAELVAIERRGRGEGSLVAPLLGFRLDPANGAG
jgi:hypothetical protein